MVNRYVVIVAVAVVVVLGGSIFFLGPQGSQSSSSSSSSAQVSSSSSSTPSTSASVSTASSSSSSSSSPSSSVVPTTTTSTSSSSSSAKSSSSSTTVALNNYRFLVFTQKGMVELVSPDGTLLGYTRLYNISNSVPTQTYYYDGYPLQVASQTNFLIPLNNGTVEVVNGNTMAIQQRLSVGTAIGFIGISISPDQQYAAIADGPSGVVQVFKLSNAQSVWKVIFNKPDGTTAYPCDVRWSPDGTTLAVPMRANGTIDVLNSATGSIVATTSVPASSLPYMLTINWQGNVLGVELAGNKTVVFYSYPTLKPLGTTSFSISTFSPVRGLFTQDGKYYLEAGATTNVVEVISTSNFAVVNTINLPASGSPGSADFEMTPDGANALFIVHGTPATGGIFYFIPLANPAAVSAASASIALTTAPSLAIPVSVQFGTYLADNVLSPPVTGLHC